MPSLLSQITLREKINTGIHKLDLSEQFALFSSSIEICPVDKFEIVELAELDNSIYTTKKDQVKMINATTL